MERLEFTALPQEGEVGVVHFAIVEADSFQMSDTVEFAKSLWTEVGSDGESPQFIQRRDPGDAELGRARSIDQPNRSHPFGHGKRLRPPLGSRLKTNLAAALSHVLDRGNALPRAVSDPDKC